LWRVRHHPHPFSDIISDTQITTAFIVLKVELPFKCNPEEFERIYQEKYKNKISHGFIRSSLGLSESVRLKLNGTFKRWLYLLDEDNRLYRVQYRIQTALWTDPETGKHNYVSIFPNFIKRYCPLCLHMLEYLSCQVGKGEDILRHIDDPEELILCEDRIVRVMRRLERDCARANYPAFLNSRYTDVYNRPIILSGKQTAQGRRFPWIYALVITARQFFGNNTGVLALVNTVINL